MRMKGKGGIQGIPGMKIVVEQEIAEVEKGVPAGRIDIKTISKEGLKEIFPKIKGILHPQEIIITGGKEVFPKAKDIPHPQEIITEGEKEVFPKVKGIGHPREIITSLMTNLDTTAVVTLDPLEKGEDHLVPSQEIGIDQETEDIVNIIIHNLTQEVKIEGTKIRDLLVETIIEDEVITEDTRLDSRQGLNHLQDLDIDLPVIPELQKSLL